MSDMFLSDAEFAFGFKSRRQKEQEKRQRINARIAKGAAAASGLGLMAIAAASRNPALRNRFKTASTKAVENLKNARRSGAYRIKRSNVINDVGVGRRGVPIMQRQASEVANTNLNTVNARRRNRGLNALPAAGGTGGKPVSRWKKMRMNVRAAAVRATSSKTRV